MRLTQLCALTLAGFALSQSAMAQTPQYAIVDLGLLGTNKSANAYGISAGGIAVGREYGSSSGTAVSWTQAGGTQALTGLAGYNYAKAMGANDAGAIVGGASGTLTGASVPVIWQNGQAQALALPTGYTNGVANAINASGVAVGSAGPTNGTVAAVYSNGTATVMPTLASGGQMVNAYGINSAGLAVGYGNDPTNQSLRVGLVYNTQTGAFTNIGNLAGENGAIAYGINDSGEVVGQSMLNQGGTLPVTWTQAGGMQAIPLLAGDTLGTAYGVNSSGWVVGSMGINTVNPFLYEGGNTYDLSALIPANSGWLLDSGISSAVGISDSGVITGTAELNGAFHAYALVPITAAVPEPGSYALLLAGLGAVGWVTRRRIVKA